MNYWEGKCFMCLFWGTLIAIIGLSAKPIYDDIKKTKKKNEKVIVNDASISRSTDSTSSM